MVINYAAITHFTISINQNTINMPAFLEKKLKKEYPDDDHAVYGTLNKLGLMKGNKETAKGRMMARKHARKMGAKIPLRSLMKSRSE